MNQLHTVINRIKIAAFLLLISFSVQSQSNYAVNFDGTDDYISLPTSVAVSQSNTFTIEAWVYWNGTNNGCIYSETVLGNNNPMFSIIPRSSDGGGIELTFRDNSATGLILQPATAKVTANTWVHVAVVRTSATNMKIYIDGVLKDDATFTAPASWTPTKVNTGVRWRVGQTDFFAGKIDELRIWNTTRTETQIKANMFNRNLANNATGLVAYYKMNDGSGTTAVNSCTNTSSIDGTLTNGPTWSASPVQFAGNALKFNGSSNYVELTNRINIGSSDFTIESWVYPQSTSAGMVFAQDVCGNGEHQFRFYTNNSKVNFDLSDAGALGAPYSFQLPSTANSVPLNTWTHIAVTRSGNNYTLYINGISNASHSTGANTINNQSGADVNKRLRIGARGGVSIGCGLNYFNGSIDEVRLWGVTRTGTEIQQNYAKEIDPSANANLVAYYTFNQGIAGGTNIGITTIIDQKGTNNGTLNGFSLTGATSNFVTQNSGMSILPLKWLSFTAQKRNGYVLLQWSTASETNTSNFVIEHSTNGIKWETLASLAALNRNETNFYNYTHAAPANGMNQYRIRQNDKDGRYSYSTIRTVQMSTEIGSFEVLSNPVQNKTLQIQINTETKQTLTLFSSDGKIVWQKELTPGMHAVDLSTAGKGIYILSSRHHSEKLVLQ
jgi:hypothetical protein